MDTHIRIRKPDDFHVHFRQDVDLPCYVRASSAQFARALVMPNTQPPLRTIDDILSYGHAIKEADPDFTPLLTYKIYQEHRYEDIARMNTHGVVAGKLYPQGATTNAEDGIEDISAIFPVCEAMQSLDMVLCIHGEDPDSFVLDREKNFLHVLSDIRSQFPTLRIVLEHVSSKEGIEYVSSQKSDFLSATITVHHLLYTLDEVVGNVLNPHMFCKPILKTPADLHAIQQVVLEGNPLFFLGTDSAPHKKGKKECAEGCAGIFSAPVAMPLLCQFFFDHAHLWKDDMWIRKLESFTSQFGADFYGLPRNENTLTLAQSRWKVPAVIDGVVPLCANAELDWRSVQ